jgi:hypothetical protein
MMSLQNSVIHLQSYRVSEHETAQSKSLGYERILIQTEYGKQTMDLTWKFTQAGDITNSDTL